MTDFNDQDNLVTTEDADWDQLLPHLTAEERAFVESALVQDRARVWDPLPGPQTMAYESEAEIIGFGGAAGGGKTDLAVGLALTKHRRALMVRKEGTQLNGIVDRLISLLGTRDGYTSSPEKVWREAGPNKVQINFGSLANPGDETKQQGNPKDLLVLDETTNLLEAPCRFLMGWVRTTEKGQKTRTLMTFNPPTTAEGRWVIDFFAPWLDPKFPQPAEPGEIRWCAAIAGKDMWVESGKPFVLGPKNERNYDYNPEDYKGPRKTLVIQPKSRTFIPSRITDNPYLVDTGYMSQLQAMPEPLRSQMLYGDFTAGMEDDPMQVIPTAWVDAAMARWDKPLRLAPMSSLGCDVARGGKDSTAIARRHGMWFDEPLIYPGTETPDGPKTASLVIAATRDSAPQHIDVIGVGSSPYDFLVESNQQVVGVNVSHGSYATDKSGRLTFFNTRSELWWKFREALDPTNNTGIQLPPNNQLRADLCAPKWELRGTRIFVESRDGIVKRIGRSPDLASAYILALMDTPKVRTFNRHIPGMGSVDSIRNGSRNDYDPYSNMK